MERVKWNLRPYQQTPHFAGFVDHWIAAIQPVLFDKNNKEKSVSEKISNFETTLDISHENFETTLLAFSTDPWYRASLNEQRMNSYERVWNQMSKTTITNSLPSKPLTCSWKLGQESRRLGQTFPSHSSLNSKADAWYNTKRNMVPIKSGPSKERS